MTRFIVAASLLVLLCGAPASAQDVAVEVGQGAGVSTEDIAGVGTQVRVLAETEAGLRFEVEGAWGARSADLETDVFGTAYPYEDGFQVIEAYGEYFFAPQRWVRSVKGGRYRTPFGISAASEHAYIGFLRPPLIRYGGYYALSSGYLEHGVDVVVGAPRLSVEMSVGTPADVGDAIRRDGIDTVVRAEGHAGSLIVGVSYLDTTPYLPEHWAKGRARFGGVDARWMGGGVQVRGEWLGGRPFDGTTTTGRLRRPDRAPAGHGSGDGAAACRAAGVHGARATRALLAPVFGSACASACGRGWPSPSASATRPASCTQSRPTAIDLGVSYSARRDF